MSQNFTFVILWQESCFMVEFGKFLWNYPYCSVVLSCKLSNNVKWISIFGTTGALFSCYVGKIEDNIGISPFILTTPEFDYYCKLNYCQPNQENHEHKVFINFPNAFQISMMVNDFSQGMKTWHIILSLARDQWVIVFAWSFLALD